MALNCVNCGGGLQPVGNRNYFSCPYCQSFHFPETTPDGVTVLGEDTKYDCPVCEEKLVAATIHGDRIRYCQRCRGFLADNPSFGRIVHRKRAAQQSSTHVPVPFSPAELKRRVKCPRCRKLMDVHPYHGGGNAVIDTCYRCHLIWLDAGEVSVIGEYPGRSPKPVSLPEPEPTPRHQREDTDTATALGGDVITIFGFRIKVR
jgi:Zn-finger nucleic acid-binding protein